MNNPIEKNCTLPSAEFIVRRSTLESEILAQAVNCTSIPDGLKLEFKNNDDLQLRIEKFILRERDCCQFLKFALRKSEQKLELTIHGSPEATDFISAMIDNS